MRFIKNKNFLRNVIAVMITLCIIACICALSILYIRDYRITAQKALAEVTAEKDLIISSLNASIDSMRVELTDISAELANITVDLEQAKETISEQALVIDNQKAEIKEQSEEIKKQNSKIKEKDTKINKQAEELAKYKKTSKKTSTTSKSNTSTKNQQSTKKYAVATEAWKAMKKFGWSDTVCAGIMGNLMAETGGGTLNLDWDSNSGGCYGLVQWTGGRKTAIKNKYGKTPTVKQQIQFIHDELYGTNGVRQQVTSSQLKKIMNAKTPEDCAYAFASYYERCATQYRSPRKGYARKAYNYFT